VITAKAGADDDRWTYLVRIWDVKPYKGKRRTTYVCRWVVAGKQFTRTLTTRKLADSFRASLTTAAAKGEPFHRESGLPRSMQAEANTITWYEHACAFVDMKWPHASPRHRKNIAEALASVTPSLLATDRGAPGRAELRHALYTWSFNTSARSTEPADKVRRTAQWAASNTVTLSAMTDAAVIRRALDALALTLKGTPAAANTVAWKRAVFYGALRYAVELGHLPSNPIDRVQWSGPRNAESIDRRVVVNHRQARKLLAAVREGAPAMEAFYACMYYAALRPAEVIHLRAANVTLPSDEDPSDWGELLLTGSTQYIGEAWGAGHGERREDRALKHRADSETRRVPVCPDLVRILRAHLDAFGTGPDGRLFVTRVGKFGKPVAGPYASPITPNTYARIWRNARKAAFTPQQAASPLAARPYDLRHAAVSTWLNAGVPATQVAEWAGHSVHVLLKVYAKCIDGQESSALRRIEAALRLGDEGPAAGTS
jgi:hypothetical protein